VLFTGAVEAVEVVKSTEAGAVFSVLTAAAGPREEGLRV